MGNYLEVRGSELYFGGKPFKLRSGTIHYFRVHPSQWRDRLEKLRACGLNTVETYIAWNMHERTRGVFDFDGICDFEKFISIAEELGLCVIVRPGPFICAEWEMGGFPSWLLSIDGMELRHNNEPYMECVRDYFAAIFPRLIPHLSVNGGGIIAMQVENEFGGLGQPDGEYLRRLLDEFMKYDIKNTLLFTSDGSWGSCLEDGCIDGVLMTANFGSRADEVYKRLQTLRPGSPFICMEFWNGWFDQWGEKHHVRKPDGIIAALEEILKKDGHFNIYMFEGGTNFGFYNGSNCNPTFEPTITSYDYGAVLTEDGEITEQYTMLRELLKKYDGINPPPVPPRTKKAAYGKVEFKAASVFDNISLLGAEYKSDTPLVMEDVGQSFGYILYTADVSGISGKLDMGEPHDRAMVWGDGRLLGVHERGRKYDDIYIENVSELRILVENMGRVNYGAKIYDQKGLVDPVKIGAAEVHGFTVNTLPFDTVPELPPKTASDEPMLYTAELDVDEPLDTFLYPDGFTHGIAFVNGFNLGRYRSMGPQRTLYVPGGVLRRGKNKLVILDLYPAPAPSAEFIDRAILDSTGLKWAD